MTTASCKTTTHPTDFALIPFIFICLILSSISYVCLLPPGVNQRGPTGVDGMSAITFWNPCQPLPISVVPSQSVVPETLAPAPAPAAAAPVDRPPAIPTLRLPNGPVAH